MLASGQPGTAARISQGRVCCATYQVTRLLLQVIAAWFADLAASGVLPRSAAHACTSLMQLASGPRVIEVLNTLAAAALDKRLRALQPDSPTTDTPLTELLHTHAAAFAHTAAALQQQQVVAAHLVPYITRCVTQAATRDILARLDATHAELLHEEQQAQQVRL